MVLYFLDCINIATGRICLYFQGLYWHSYWAYVNHIQIATERISLLWKGWYWYYHLAYVYVHWLQSYWDSPWVYKFTFLVIVLMLPKDICVCVCVCVCVYIYTYIDYYGIDCQVFPLVCDCCHSWTIATEC